MLKKNLSILLCVISVASPAFGMDWFRGLFARNVQEQAPAGAVEYGPAVNPQAIVPVNVIVADEIAQDAQEAEVVPTAGVMDIESEVTIYKPASLATLASKAAFTKFTQTKAELQEAPMDVKEKFIEAALRQYAEKSYVTSKEIHNLYVNQGNRTQNNVITNMPKSCDSISGDVPAGTAHSRDGKLFITPSIKVECISHAIQLIDVDTKALVGAHLLADNEIEKNVVLHPAGPVVWCSLNGECRIISWDKEKQESSLDIITGDGLEACIGTDYYVVNTEDAFESINHLWHRENGQLQDLGILDVYEAKIKGSTKAVILLRHGDLCVFDKTTNLMTKLPAAGKQDFKLCGTTQVAVATQDNTVAVWDFETGQNVCESAVIIPAGATLDRALNEQFVIVQLPNYTQRLWDIKNNTCVKTSGVGYEILAKAFEGRVLMGDINSALELWDSATDACTILSENIQPECFTKKYIVARDPWECIFKIWDAQTLELLYQPFVGGQFWNIEFNQEKNQLETYCYALPVSLLEPLDALLHKMAPEQLQYVFDVLCYLDEVFCNGGELVTKFSTPEFNALPGLVQRLLCNYFKAQAEKKGYTWELVEGKDAVYQVTEIMPALETEYQEHEVQAPVESANSVSYSTLSKVGAGALAAVAGVLAYKWFAGNLNN